MAEAEAVEAGVESEVVKRVRKFEGVVDVPGSQSISIQALAMAAKIEGETVINRCAITPAVRYFAEQLKGFGVSVSFEGERVKVICSEAIVPEGEISAASIESYAALAGLSVGQGVVLTGDESFRSEASRVLDVLNAFEAVVRHGEEPFPADLGKVSPKPGTYPLGLPDSNVKTALFLGALEQEGLFELQQGLSGEDDLEILFRRAGGRLEKARIDDADGYRITSEGPQRLKECSHELPGDATGALFILAAVAIRRKSEVEVLHVGRDWRTRRLIDLLRRLNLTIVIDKTQTASGFSSRSLKVKSEELRRIKIADEYAALFLNEVPTFAVVGACAVGETVIRDIASLRDGDVDVISLMVEGLRLMGVRVGEMPDGLVIQGVNTLQGAEVDAGGDPRCGIAFTIAGFAADGETKVLNPGPIEETYPGVLSRIHSVAITGR